MRSLCLSPAMCCVAAVATLSTLYVPAQALRGGSAGPQRVSAAAPSRIMTLDPLPAEEAPAESMVMLAKTAQKRPANFRQFDAISKGQIGDTQTLTLRFAKYAKLMTIKSTPDFKIEQGGSCVEGFSYAANETCTLLVRSTPKGPGYRLGKLEITNSAEVTPLFVGLGGYGYAPTISFTPSIISTVPGTYVSGAGTISGAYNLAADGGDSLYIADTGNNAIRSIDSSGTIVTIPFANGSNAPISVIVDHNGFVYFTSQTQQYFLNILEPDGSSVAYSSGSTGCTIDGMTCPLAGAYFYLPGLGDLALDASGNVFLDAYFGAAQIEVLQDAFLPLSIGLNSGIDSFFPEPLAVDSSDTLYTYYAGAYGPCIITGLSLYNAETNADYSSITVAGNQNCGFSGDGGQARGAEIGKQVGQMVFDNAGNLYFSDTLNQRVRRIDNSTGIITTIAENGATGYYGDGGPATAAALNNPTGVGVDSQGQVYILSNSATTGPAQVVRKVGVVGALNLGSGAVGTASTSQTVTLANTGNSQLDFTHVGFSSGNTSDFAIDPNTTSCNFTVALAAGRSCKIGFIFTPSAAGTRTAMLSITDDTIAGVNTIQLSGSGYTSATLTPASLSYASTTVGSSTAPQVATLTNTGKATMTISSIAFSGTGATSYTDTTTCGATLGTGASCTISVAFKPTAVGSLPATLTVTDNALGGHQTVALSGTGAASTTTTASATPSSVAFAGTTKVGSSSAYTLVTFKNTGTATLTGIAFSVTGTNASSFFLPSAHQGCSTTLAAGASCTFDVGFEPTTSGSLSGTVRITDSASNSPQTVALSGTGAAAGAVVKPKVTLASTLNNLAMGDTVSLSAQVAGDAATPTGNVRLMDGDRMIAVETLSQGMVQFTVEGLSEGKHVLQAIYMGDTRNAQGSSALLTKWVNLPTRRFPVGHPQ